MTVTLAGEPISGTIELLQAGHTVEVMVRCSSLTADQVAACSSSCNGGARVACSDGSKTYTGACQKLCVQSHGCTCHIRGCTVS